MAKTIPAEPADDNDTDAAAEAPSTAPTVPLSAEAAHTETVSTADVPPHPGVAAAPVAASSYANKRPRWLAPVAIIGGAVLAAGLVFGGGVALGLALPDGHGPGHAQVAPGGAPGTGWPGEGARPGPDHRGGAGSGDRERP